MAAENLGLAADAVGEAAGGVTVGLPPLVERIGLTDDEVAMWRRAAEQMYLPYDETAGVHLQDDSFLDQAPWDFAGTPPGALPAAAALPPAGHLPAPGHQAGRRRARHRPAAGPVHRRGAPADLRVLRPAHHRRLVPLGVHPGDRRRRRGEVPQAEEYLVDAASPSTWPTPRATSATASTSRRPAARGWRWCTASPGTGGEDTRVRTDAPHPSPPRPLSPRHPRIGARGRHRSTQVTYSVRRRRSGHGAPLRHRVHGRTRLPGNLPRRLPHD